jgi:hypothetical protein
MKGFIINSLAMDMLGLFGARKYYGQGRMEYMGSGLAAPVINITV